MVNLRGILAVLTANAFYFVLTDSASLNRLTLIPFQWWIGIVSTTVLLLVLPDLKESGMGDYLKIALRFSFWLSIINGIFLALFPFGSTISPILVGSSLLAHIVMIVAVAISTFNITKPKEYKFGWSSYLIFLSTLSLLTVSAFFNFPSGLILTLFVIGEISFLGGLSYLLYKNRDKHEWFVWLFLSGIGSFLFGWFATGNDVMFLVSNLVLTRVIGSLSLEGVVGGVFLYFLILVQFTVAFVLLVLMKRSDLIALGLTGISFTFPPILAVRSLIFMELRLGQKPESSDH